MHETSMSSGVTLGSSGDGKSTLLNFLGRKPLTAENKNGVWCVNTLDPIQGMEIGVGANAMTALPSYWRDPESRLVYYDCPGVGDTRGVEKDLVNAFSIQKLFKTFRNVKILLCIAEDSVQAGRAPGFRNLVETMGEFFERDLPQLPFSLVVTKQNGFQDAQQVKAYIAGIVDISPLGRGFIEKLRRIPRIEFFPKAREAGPFLNLETPLGRDIRARILATLNETGFIENLAPSLTTSPDARALAERRLFATNAAARYITHLQRLINIELVQDIYTYCNAQIAHAPNLDQLRLFFATYLQTLESLHVEVLQGQEGERAAFFTTLQAPNFYERYKREEQPLEFFRAISPDIPYPIEAWINEVLTSVKDKIRASSTPPVSVHNNGVLEIKGTFVSLNSHIRPFITGNTTRVNVYSLNTLFIDCDFTNPGMSFSLSAPSWKVVDPLRTFNLTGNRGNNGCNGSFAGQDGYPGGPGQSGGNFYGRGRTFTGIEKLNVISHGGSGGNGGNGAQGTNGASGQDGSPARIDQAPEDKVRLPDRRGNLAIDGNNTHYSARIYDVFKVTKSVAGTFGEAGGNGGRGGSGGQGGLAGSVIIEGTPWQARQLQHNGQNGTNGASGLGGSGGAHGRAYVKTFERWTQQEHVMRPGFYDWHDLNSPWTVEDGVVCCYEGSGSASSGQGRSGVNASGLQHPVIQPAIPRATIIESYRQLFTEQTQGNTNPFAQDIP